jgi:glycosyltransferase involved in cell wall biosynthesis
MNILYITYLNGDSWAGPTYSVPKQIEAQSKIDNVFWYNIRETKIDEWKEYSFYHDISEYPNETIQELPSPFNSPDIIIVEQFYDFGGKKILKTITNSGIPYVIIPRGELTKSAQKRKAWKKILGNFIIFNRFAFQAAAIQYLTEQERRDSGERWNKKGFVIPNGICFPKRTKEYYHEIGIKCISIGRIEPYHKGLDTLVKACAMISSQLRNSICKIDLFGPDYDGKVFELKEQIRQFRIDDIIEIHNGLYGEQKEKVILDSDCFIITSRFEGHPMALIEALSYGLPCVVTRGSNMKEAVEEYDAGWTSENDVVKLKDTLLKMIKEKELLRVKGKNAIRLASQFEWDKIALKTQYEYKKIIK